MNPPSNNPSSQHWHNRAAWDRLAKEQNRLAKPARDEDFINPLAAVDKPGWLGADISGQSVLCLAAGGGRQGPIYAAAGANVTVVDISPVMLELDQAVAQKRGLKLRTLEASMDDLSVLVDHQFDLVIHPVSTCYVPDIPTVYREVARVIRIGGLYISQHKQPTSLQSGLKTVGGNYPIRHSCFSCEPLPPEPVASLVRESGTLEYVHRWESLVGVMCRAGFVIEDLTEPLHAEENAAPDTFAHRSQYLPPYVRIKARRIATSEEPPRPAVWIP
jgi:ubiquinone/menaquinone biosynthesis C-methylase UbiE